MRAGALLVVALAALSACGMRVSLGELDDSPRPAARPSKDATESTACVLLTPEDRLCPSSAGDPVCGCDGKTYADACEASRFVTSATPGGCEAVDAGDTDVVGEDAGTEDAGMCARANPTVPLCPQVLELVCGCDGKTYDNPCKAAGEVTSWTQGSCT